MICFGALSRFRYIDLPGLKKLLWDTATSKPSIGTLMKDRDGTVWDVLKLNTMPAIRASGPVSSAGGQPLTITLMPGYKN